MAGRIPTYAYVFNTLFRGKRLLKTRHRVLSAPFHKRQYWRLHLNTAVMTQRNLPTPTIQFATGLAQTLKTLDYVYSMSCLRKIQRSVGRYLWRPEGVLAQKLLRETFWEIPQSLKTTQAEGSAQSEAWAASTEVVAKVPDERDAFEVQRVR